MAAPVYALNPIDLHDANGFIDYGTVEGRKAYFNAISPRTTPYDGKQRGLRIFIHDLSQKATINGWGTTIFSIPTGVAPAVVNRNLLTQYGQITVQQCRAHAATFLGQHNKASQDSNNLKLHLDSSLGPDIMGRLLRQGNRYTVNGVEDGATMLRVLISIVGIETVATVSVIRANLRTLPAKMDEVNSNIVKFNEFVREQKQELDARGESTDDLVSSLYHAYQGADDEAFVRYIVHREGAVEDGTMPALDADETMNMAETKYKTMVVKGVWKAVTKRDEEFIAMQARCDDIIKQHADSRKGGATQTKGKSNKTNPYAWKDVAPTGNDPTTRVFNGKDYMYCPHGHKNKWVLSKGHSGPEGCRLDPAKKDKKQPLKSSMRAMTTVIDDHHEEDETDSEDENI